MKNRLAATSSPAFSRTSTVVMLVAGLLGAVFLSGCVDGDAPAAETTAHVHAANMPRRPGVSPTGASVAMTTFGGVPQQLADQFKASFGQEARERQITLADANKANYLVRGYLNAFADDSGTRVSFVFDVFDARRQLAQRIEDQVSVKAAAADPWSVVDPTILAAVAARSADDLADFLTNTPEAIAAISERPAADTHQLADSDSGQTTIAATPPAPQAPAAAAARGTGFASLR
jgi:hypothetical protein